MHEYKNSVTLTSLASILSVMTLCFISPHAVEWPATASLPGAISIIDPELLHNDFFTTSSKNSPTFIFQSFLAIVAQVLATDITTALLYLGALVVAFYIPLFFFVTCFLVNSINLYPTDSDFTQREKIINFLIFVVFALIIFFWEPVNEQFTNMMWPPIFINACPYIVSMLCGLIGMMFWLRDLKIGYIFVFLSTLIHPAMGVFTSLFSFILINDFLSTQKTFRRMLQIFIPSIILLLVLAFIYRGPSIPTSDFVDIYIYQRHSHHYLISESFQFRKYVNLIFFIFLEAVGLFLLKSIKFYNAILTLLLFMLIPVVHYTFTEVFPVKFIAIIGFPRFFTFGLFFVIIFGVFLLNSILMKVKISCVTIFFCRMTSFLSLVPVATLCVLTSFVFAIVYINREFKFNERVAIDFYSEFNPLINKIKPDDVVMILDTDELSFIIYGKKNIYATDAFPFSEAKFREFADRKKYWSECKLNFVLSCLKDAANHHRLDYVIFRSSRINDGGFKKVLESSNEFSMIRIRDVLSPQSAERRFAN